MKTQKYPIGNTFQSSVMQLNLLDLFESAHDHDVKDSLPVANQGTARDLIIVDDGSNVYLCVKTSRGWFRTAALTAL